MSQHRRSTRYRKIVIAAAAATALGVPTAAMACVNGPDRGVDASHARWQNAAAHHRWQQHRAQHGRWQAAPSATGPSGSAPTAAPSQTPGATAPTPAPTASAPAVPAPGVPAPTASAPTVPAPTASASGVTARVVALVNAERAKAGCSALTVNAKLTAAAQAHSADMAAHQNMSHTGSDGSSPDQRIQRAGYVATSYGENIAYGYSTPESVMAAWMSSAGHKRNILDCSFKEIGVGLAQPGDYWTQDFGATQ